MSFETDRTSRAVVRWGMQPENLDRTLDLGVFKRIHNATLTGLDPGTRYHYIVEAEDQSGDRIDSGILTFSTAPAFFRSVKFAVIGDTEARPWINDALAKRIWEQQPDFVIHLGDLTDGGAESRKAEWTHEYFLGMNQLQSRIPVFSVPGNGEGSPLYWYRQYFPHPLDQDNRAGFYQFSYGDVDFFMLDSNFRASEFQPGTRQFQWLAARLARSAARWKIVCFHHLGTPSTFGTDIEVNALVPLFDQWGVDYVLNGHIHLYERSHPRRGVNITADGTVYVVSGGAGGNIKDEYGESKSPYAADVYRGYHYLVAAADANRLEVKMYDLSGQQRDAVMTLGGFSEMQVVPVSVGADWFYCQETGYIHTRIGFWPWLWRPLDGWHYVFPPTGGGRWVYQVGTDEFLWLQTDEPGRAYSHVRGWFNW
jgi:predicted phosphodiesterase